MWPFSKRLKGVVTDGQLGPRGPVDRSTSNYSRIMGSDDTAPIRGGGFGNEVDLPELTGDDLQAGAQVSDIGMKFDKYQPAWSRQPLPDEGTGSYSWETLGLVQFSPIGAGVVVRRLDYDAPLRTPSYVSLPSLPVMGIPTQAGAMYGQPLYDPQRNLVEAPQIQGPDVSMVAWNIPAVEGIFGLPWGINDPFPQRQKGL